MITIQFDKRKSGLSQIGDLPWGVHFCQFYRAKEDILDVLVPYFRAGLENNELCIWSTSRPISVADAKEVLQKAVPDFEQYLKKGQIEIIPNRRWQAEEKTAGDTLASRLDNAIAGGFDGLRLACHAFPEKKGGKTFTCYGADAIERYNVIAVFVYPRERFDALGLMEVVKNHRFALVRNAGRWEVIESSEVRIRDDLKKSQEKLHSLFSNMSEGFAYHRIVLDARGEPCDYVFLEVNEAFEKLTGLKGEKIIGKKVTEALPWIEKDSTGWIEEFGKVALTGKPIQFESYAETPKRWYAISAFSPHNGFFAVTFSDITERVLAEAALKSSNRKMEILAEAARLLLTSETPARIVQTICKKVMDHLDCHAFFNYLVEEGTERMRLNAYAGIPEARAAEIERLAFGVAVCGCAARDGQRIIVEDILNTPDERTDLVRSFGIQAYACHPLIYQGRIIGTLSFGTINRQRFSAEDVEIMKAITDLVATAMARKKAEEHIVYLNEELKRNIDDLSIANKDLESFSYSVSHDLRAPLRAIDGYSRMLAKELEEKMYGEGKRVLNIIRRNTQLMGQLIDDLLAFSRLGSQKIKVAEIDMKSLAEAVWEEITAANPGRSITFNITNHLPTFADTTLMRQVMVNLLSNAVKFTQHRGDALIEFTGWVEGTENVYCVKDNGVGFDMHYVDKLFGVFQRLHSVDEFEGTGVGLAIVKRAILKHGGRVWAEGKTNEGATIYFSLPREQGVGRA
ncbi:MAG TPA: MEDS domain-containing protein [Syntrophales bacterium]|nr:MEDS domain-containing protein [Syntrophales bacterium]